MSFPNLIQPACPACSGFRPGLGGRLDRPSWVYAPRTSRKREERCFFWMGCKHAEHVAPEAGKIPVGHEGFEAIEKVWAAEAETLFKNYTERWTEGARENYRRALDDRPYALAAKDTPQPGDLPLAHSALAAHQTTNNEVQ